MTNHAFNFSIVHSKEVTVATTRTKEVFPVQVSMELVIGDKSQRVQFGYSRLGGRQTYLVADGKAPVVMSRADFLNKLRAYNISNMRQVQQALSKIAPFMRDEFIVARCECCHDGYVTAANVDFIQRNHEKLSAKLGRPVTAFSKMCYKCQGHTGTPKTQAPATKPQSPPPVIPAQAQEATCECCSKKVSQKVAQFSVRQYGKVLCYKPCQSKYPKLNQPAPAPQPQVQSPAPQPKPQEVAPVPTGYFFSPVLIAEILALDVDKFSELAKLQRELLDQHHKDREVARMLWHELHEASVKNASEASVPPPPQDPPERAEAEQSDFCFICDNPMPPYAEWSHDFCPSCTVKNATGPEALRFGYPAHVAEEAAAYLKAASGASGVASVHESEVRPVPTLDSQRKEDAAQNAEDTKEVPPMKSADETVCKSPGSAVVANGPDNDPEKKEAMNIFMKEILPMQESLHGASVTDGEVPY